MPSRRTADMSPPSPGRRLMWHVVLFVGTVGLAGAITMLFHVMRSVMEVGGSCGSGGQYRYAVECPDGVPAGMMIAIFGGLLSLGVSLLASSRAKAPSIVLLAWPALFVSLGVNFLQYGIDPPDGSGVSIGLIVCGVLFEVMGVGPLLIGVSVGRDRRRTGAAARARVESPRVRRPRPPADHGEARTMLDSTWLPTSGPLPAVPPADPTITDRAAVLAPFGDGDDPGLVEDLQRLADLHRRGDLTDAEFTAAKRALLSGDA